MRYLVDGYNLLHAMGALAGRTGPGGLEKARLRLLGWLAGALGPRADQVTVVFDARHPPPGAKPQFDHDGIQVLFAIKQQEADDLIEERIQRESTPRQLTIVSDDHRLHDAARRRGCPALDALDFFELVERGRRRRPAAPPQAESASDKVSARELQHWLEEFADLEGDPDFKDFLDFDVDAANDKDAGPDFP
jgi:predicted RNA-binding protein with PIN domain